MLYTPKCCSECGSEIESDSLKFLPRRFCETCEPEFKTQRFFPLIWLSLGLIGILWGFGNYLKQPAQPVGLLTTTANTAVKNSANQANSPANIGISPPAPKNTATNTSVQTNLTVLTIDSGQKSLPVKQSVPENISGATTPIYICGAQTKKGTACLRRVKGGGRCWQHLGQPAMLPPEKLLVSR